MTLTLNRAFAANSRVDAQDTRAVKIALNRLGYYTPPAGIGITDIPDRDCFAALKNFQKDSGLRASGEMRPGDATMQALNAAGKEQEKSGGKYIWRTAQDDRVRESHAELEGTIRDWSESPVPGEEPGCRCSAELIGDTCEDERQRVAEAEAKLNEIRVALAQAELEVERVEREISNVEKEIQRKEEEIKEIEEWIIALGVGAGSVAGGIVGGIRGGPGGIYPGVRGGAKVGWGLAQAALRIAKMDLYNLQGVRLNLLNQLAQVKQRINELVNMLQQTQEELRLAKASLEACLSGQESGNNKG